jgi:GTPase
MKKIHTTEADFQERAVLVILHTGKDFDWTPEDILAELKELTETAGAEVVEAFTQIRTTPDVSFFIGKGKAEEIGEFCGTNDVDTVILSDELSPRQKRNLEEKLSCKIVDRTELILDIFAQRALSKEGKLQVELAQLNYLLPHLTGKGTSLSRLGGGIGTRGPGETKLETDRRHIRTKIHEISKEIEEVKKQRALHRKRRQSVPVPTISLVGYTNAGKSSLLNYLSDADVLAEDKLFATLDPTTRNIALPNNHEILLTDTVGFIHNLPHHLVAAFRATLEEVVEADILLHVVDVSHNKFQEHMVSVQEVLKELGIGDKKTFTALNKIDRLDKDISLSKLQKSIPDSVLISAKTGEGIHDLLNALADYLDRSRLLVTLQIPYQRGDLVSLVHNYGQVVKEEHSSEVTVIKAYIDKTKLSVLEPYISDEF